MADTREELLARVRRELDNHDGDLEDGLSRRLTHSLEQLFRDLAAFLSPPTSGDVQQLVADTRFTLGAGGYPGRKWITSLCDTIDRLSLAARDASKEYERGWRPIHEWSCKFCGEPIIFGDAKIPQTFTAQYFSDGTWAHMYCKAPPPPARGDGT